MSSSRREAGQLPAIHTIDLHGADPNYFPPLGSVAAGLARHLGKHGAIASALGQEARSMASAFSERVERLREVAAADEGEWTCRARVESAKSSEAAGPEL